LQPRDIELAVSIQIAASNAEGIEIAGTEAQTLGTEVGVMSDAKQ
jgi:paraquat-inducible protein B